jgi:hypothetical protein
MRSAILALIVTAAAAPAAVRAQAADAGQKPAWSTSFYLDGYFQPDAAAFFVPTLFADRGRLHLEARYSYEDFDTASLWAGWAFTFGGDERYAKLTPMVGGVFGNTNGVAPGLEVEAKWGRFSYWLEAEYLLDLSDSAASYLYTWSEGYVSVVPWLWAGASVQRLRVVDSPRELDVGPMIGVGKPGAPGWSLSLYAYGLTTSTTTWLVTGAAAF